MQWQSNGAWGERRYQQWNGPLDNLLNPDSTAKGFTDHEHLDAVGLIHMNGRVYDPELGRFMSADPFVQAPYNSQSYNRYSYVFNNPLSFTDPTGYITKDHCPGNETAACTADDKDKEERPPEELDVPGNPERANRVVSAVEQSNIASWRATEDHGEQWAYVNNMAYNINSYWGVMLYSLAAGGYGSSNSNNGSDFSYANFQAQQDVMQINPWDGGVWATGYTNDQHTKALVLGMASVVPVGYGVSWGGRLLSFFKFGKVIKGTTLPDKYWINKKSVEQVSPGTRVLNDYKKASSSGGTYHQSTHYDKFGRLIGRTDRTSHGDSSVHPNPHHHRIDPVTRERLKAPDGSRVWPGLFGN